MSPARTTREYIEEAERFGASNYAPLPVVLCRGEGCYVWDVDGKRYLDALSGYSTVNQGHRHPRIVAALVEQAQRLTLTSRAFHNDKLGAFLRRLCALTGFPRALPMNTGVEAVETAIKAMRRWGYQHRGIPPDQAEIVVAEGNFHGRTVLAVSLSSEAASAAGFGPRVPGFVRVPFGDANALASAIGPRTAGVFIEPVQGEAGVVLPPAGYLARVRELCTARRVPLCLDEVQTGFGRTGKMFAWEHWDAKPDLICLGKALSGGVYPISAVCGTEEIMGVFTPGSHGSTYGGNPLAAAIGMVAIDVIVEEDLPRRAARMGERVLAQLKEELTGAAPIADVRGLGLLVAVQFHQPVAHRIVEALARDAAVLCKDTHDYTVRFMPPLNTPEDVLLGAVERMLPILAAG